jgi:hypothetical protein
VEYSSEEEGDRFMKGDGNAAQRYPQRDPQRVPTNEPFSLSFKLVLSVSNGAKANVKEILGCFVCHTNLAKK